MADANCFDDQPVANFFCPYTDFYLIPRPDKQNAVSLMLHRPAMPEYMLRVESAGFISLNRHVPLELGLTVVMDQDSYWYTCIEIADEKATN